MGGVCGVGWCMGLPLGGGFLGFVGSGAVGACGVALLGFRALSTGLGGWLLLHALGGACDGCWLGGRALGIGLGGRRLFLGGEGQHLLLS